MDRLESMSTLLAAVEAGSLSAASRKLGMPLATVSRKVSELEAHLRIRLINRNSRRLTLTDAGRSYVRAPGLLGQPSAQSSCWWSGASSRRGAPAEPAASDITSSDDRVLRGGADAPGPSPCFTAEQSGIRFHEATPANLIPENSIQPDSRNEWKSAHAVGTWHAKLARGREGRTVARKGRGRPEGPSRVLFQHIPCCGFHSP